MTDVRYFDTPAHPLGLVTHPDWSSVRDRWNERHCAKVMREARPQQSRWTAVDRDCAIAGCIVVAVSLIAALLSLAA